MNSHQRRIRRRLQARQFPLERITFTEFEAVMEARLQAQRRIYQMLVVAAASELSLYEIATEQKPTSADFMVPHRKLVVE